MPSALDPTVNILLPLKSFLSPDFVAGTGFSQLWIITRQVTCSALLFVCEAGYSSETVSLSCLMQSGFLQVLPHRALPGQLISNASHPRCSLGMQGSFQSRHSWRGGIKSLPPGAPSLLCQNQVE